MGELCSQIDWLKAANHKATGYKSEAECKAKIEDFKIGQYAHIPAVVEASCYTWYAMLDKKVQEVLTRRKTRTTRAATNKNEDKNSDSDDNTKDKCPCDDFDCCEACCEDDSENKGEDNSEKKGMSAGAIIGCIVVVAMIAAVIGFVIKK